MIKTLLKEVCGIFGRIADLIAIIFCTYVFTMLYALSLSFSLWKRIKKYVNKSNLAISVLVLLILSIVAIIYAENAVTSNAAGKMYSSIKKIPAKNVGMILGASPGSSTLLERLKGAAKLYHAGKVKSLLVSGDNSRHDYDEVGYMKNVLIHYGVPSNNIYQDHAGFRTLDSVVRTNKVFSQNDFTIISQGYHVKRALYLAEQKGIKAIGYVAGEAQTSEEKIRESLARVKAVLDIVTEKEPKFYGPQVAINTNYK